MSKRNRKVMAGDAGQNQATRQVFLETACPQAVESWQRCLNRHEGVPAPKTATLLTVISLGMTRARLLARFFLEAVVGQFGTVLYLAADVRRFHEPNPSGIPGSSDQRHRCAR